MTNSLHVELSIIYIRNLMHSGECVLSWKHIISSILMNMGTVHAHNIGEVSASYIIEFIVTFVWLTVLRTE
jgi:hypothetical protein